jgi:hypothetical protein
MGVNDASPRNQSKYMNNSMFLRGALWAAFILMLRIATMSRPCQILETWRKGRL